MNSYLEALRQAAVIFPIVAALFTVPYIAFNYHKYGSVFSLRIAIVYSFILYLICIYCLVILPLPTGEAAEQLHGHSIQLIPFAFLGDMAEQAGFVLTQPRTWPGLFTNWAFFTALFNLVMTLPFGVYLRYYFRCSWRKTLVLSFLLSLFFELTQLSGLYFIYPGSYRVCDVDDLITNTLGAALGYLVAPLPMKILPSQERLDHVAYRKGERVSIFRAAVAAGVDWALCAIVAVPVSAALGVRSGRRILFIYIASVLVYFIFIQYLTGGRTLGKALCRVRLVREDGGRPKFWQVAVRCISLYLILLAAPWAGFGAWNGMIDATGWRFFALGAAAILCLGVFAIFVFTCFINLITRASRLPHERLSRTRNESTLRRARDI